MVALIDPETDTLFTVHAIVKERLGTDINSSTVWRWVRHGVRGVKLEAIQILGAWHTTPQAFGAFLAAQSGAALAAAAPDPKGKRRGAPRTPTKAARLRAAGLLK